MLGAAQLTPQSAKFSDVVHPNESRQLVWLAMQTIVGGCKKLWRSTTAPTPLPHATCLINELS